MAKIYKTIELPIVGDRKTADKVRLTDLLTDISDLVASGALTEELTPELSLVLLLTAAHPDDHSTLEKLANEDPLTLIAVASGLRLSITKRQQLSMKNTFEAFKVGGDPKAQS